MPPLALWLLSIRRLLSASNSAGRETAGGKTVASGVAGPNDEAQVQRPCGIESSRCSRLQNLCGRVAHGSVGSTPAPLRTPDREFPQGFVALQKARARHTQNARGTARGRWPRGRTVAYEGAIAAQISSLSGMSRPETDTRVPVSRSTTNRPACA